MRPPEFWNHKDGRDSAPMIRLLLWPISWIYGWAAARRIKTTESYNSGVPVICIGNATLGGTGKTPVAIYLLNSLRRMGLNVVGLTRGYARAAVSHGAQIIVMDDGHQNPLLEKSLSLLVVDAETGFGNGCVFPAGPLREKLSDALDRADAIILMKPTPDYNIDDELAAQLKGMVVIPAYLSPEGDAPKGKLYAFAGIGRPNKFFDSLKRHGGEVVGEYPFSDHYKYKDGDIEQLFLLASEMEAGLITTEKDYVRLPRGYRKGVQVWPVKVVFEDELTLRRILHPVIEATKNG